MKGKRVLIETYKGVEIYYDLTDTYLYVEYPKMDITLREKNIVAMRYEIENLFWEDCDNEGFIKDYLRGLNRVVAFRKNKKTKCISYKVIESSKGYSSDKGKVVTDEKVFIYPKNKHNENVWNYITDCFKQIRKMEAEIDRKIESLVK